MISNKKAGTTFEHEFCILAHEHGFWAHLMQASKQGQPADVLLCKNNIPALIDCKDCENNVFPFSRIEENQWYAMATWIKKGNKLALFALKLGTEIYLIPFKVILRLAQSGVKQLNQKQIIEQSYTFIEWEVGFNADNNQ